MRVEINKVKWHRNFSMKSLFVKIQILFVILLGISGCGDFQIVWKYKTSEIVDKIKSFDYQDGDFLFADKICIIHPGEPPINFSSIEDNWDISEIFFFIIRKPGTQDEIVESVHEGWIERGFQRSICETDNTRIVVRNPTENRIRIELLEVN